MKNATTATSSTTTTSVITTNTAKRNQAMAKADSAEVSQKPAAKKPKIVSTKDLQYPSLVSFKDLWTDTSLDEDSLRKGDSLFGAKMSWFVRDSYIALLDDILNDTRRVQVVHGSAGIGKSSFLLYVLAWMRLNNKNVLLHFHRLQEEAAKAVFFPANGEPQQISSRDQGYGNTFSMWYSQINNEGSFFLVDGIVSFGGVPEHMKVNYVVAKSPSCSIGWVKKEASKSDRWLDVWEEKELLSYADQVDIDQSVVKENMRHLAVS